MDNHEERWIAVQKEWEADYQDYLEWSETYEVPDDGQATDFMIIMFWWVPILPVFLLANWLGWVN